jgi:hypothetical protein
MARDLTTPVVRPDVTQQAITYMRFNIPHIQNTDSIPAMEINRDNIKVEYEVTTYNEDGEIISQVMRGVPFSIWPAGFITDMRSAYSRLENEAEAAGLIGPGTSEPL